MLQKVGKVLHYFPKITVAVVKLTKGDLKLGDIVRLTEKEGKVFDQEIKSMQIEHASIEIAKKGDEFGLKVQKTPKIQSEVIKIK